jgi:hypothetical protein
VSQRIADGFLDCAVYIYPSEAAAEAGDHIGGSGFIIGYPINPAPWIEMYIVTNRHLVANRDAFLRFNTKLGKTEIKPAPKDSWVSHPNGDDVAVCAFGESMDEYRYNHIDSTQFMTPEIQQKEDIGIGDEVFMVGRFINHEGKQLNHPALRYGNIAMMTSEPIKDERAGIEQQSYIIECRSMGGYSGSPVFVTTMPLHMARARRENTVRTFPRGPWLLGINWCHIHHRVPTKVASCDTFVLTEPQQVQPGGEYVYENTGMAGVVPVSKLIELLESDEVKEQRRESEKELARELASESMVALDSADEPMQTTPEGERIPIPTKEQFFGDIEKASRQKT